MPNNTKEKPDEPVTGTPLEQGYDKMLWNWIKANETFALNLRNELLARINKVGSRGGSGTATYFASIKSGSGLSYVADIYNQFASDMTFTAIDAFATDVTVKVPDSALDDTFSLTAGQVYPVSQYLVDGIKTWVITEHVGIS